MDNKIIFGIMTIIFNSIGVPCFIQGKVKAGVWRIILGFITFGIVSFINEILGIIQGIKILCMSDDEYAASDVSELLSGFPRCKQSIKKGEIRYCKRCKERGKETELAPDSTSEYCESCRLEIQKEKKKQRNWFFGGIATLFTLVLSKFGKKLFTLVLSIFGKK